MTMQISGHSIDFVQEQFSISLDNGSSAHISLLVKLPTPGNQTEEELRTASLAEAKRVLHEAISAL